jgi:tRNA(fMet)-specific endonuclease VapC
MKKYLLDTNICIHFLKGEFDLQSKIDEVGFENCFISELTIAELLFGVENSAESKREQNQQNVDNLKLSFGIRIIPINSCFELYAKEKARLRKEGTPIGEFDLIIGCTSITNQMIMATRNVKHLGKIENIILENWIDELQN